ncbi:hypothetical protein [Streptomyces sp. NPDC059201]|uniref:hypothetical protein n=1 Tax=Streptomyces sp. NPDC059201 TaxID=3346767 RepID=UPI0036B79331
MDGVLALTGEPGWLRRALTWPMNPSFASRLMSAMAASSPVDPVEPRLAVFPSAASVGKWLATHDDRWRAPTRATEERHEAATIRQGGPT